MEVGPLSQDKSYLCALILACVSLVMKMDYRKHYTRYLENLLSFVGILER